MRKVITYGTFDLFHEGHRNLLRRAKELGDYLIVGVTTEHYDLQRGKLNVVNSLLERIENVKNSGYVDEILIEDHEGQKLEDIQKLGVDVFTVGSDWVGKFDYLKPYCEVVYLERTPDISSTQLRQGQYPIIQLGIVGTGRIAPRFLSEAKYVSGINAKCVYNPHKISAQAFGQKYELEACYGEYEAFFEKTDAVYIASPHQTHFDYAKRALEASKHVLCEKPLAFSVKEAEELFAIAKQNNVILLEGIKTAYAPGFTQLVNIAKSGKIGEIVDVEACFTRLTADNKREMLDEEYGGSFTEFASYTLLPIIKLMGCDYEDVTFHTVKAENGIDLYTKAHFRYKNGMALSKTGLGVKSEGQLVIAGTKGYILAQSPWWLTKAFEVRYEDSKIIEKYSPRFLGGGLRYEVSEFVSQIHDNSKSVFHLSREDSVAMAGVMEKFMKECR